MTAFSKATAALAKAPPAPAVRTSKYAGIECADTRDPLLGVGAYRVRVLSGREGHNPGKHRDSYKVSLYVLAASDGAETPIESTCVMICMVTSPGLKELKRFAIAAAGFGPTSEQRGTPDFAARAAVGERDYEEFESQWYDGAIIEATAGRENGAPSLAGRIVDVVVGKGKPVINPQSGEPTGDYYRTYAWCAVADEHQA